MKLFAWLGVATVVVATVAACGSSSSRTSAPQWLRRLAHNEARVFSQSHPSRIKRVRVIVGSTDAIELWGRFECDRTSCLLGSCEPPDGVSVRTPPKCVIPFRYIRETVNPKTHRLGSVTKIR